MPTQAKLARPRSEPQPGQFRTGGQLLRIRVFWAWNSASVRTPAALSSPSLASWSSKSPPIVGYMRDSSWLTLPGSPGISRSANVKAANGHHLM